MLPKDGTPCWYTCYASIIFDENRTPSKLVGKLALMNSVVKESTDMEYIPTLDALTHVCAKESAEAMRREAIKKQSQDTLTALMLVDIRNYKNINEVRKSIKGEDILTSIASVLKENFRTTDIIGRIGLSEFIVYFKEMPADNLAYHKAEKLCTELEGLYSYPHTKNGLVVSIGMTLQRGNQDYETMLANANSALVMAKKTQTSSFEVIIGETNR
jgi:diguanylate cyclase (GGDEF)-like protein